MCNHVEIRRKSLQLIVLKQAASRSNFSTRYLTFELQDSCDITAMLHYCCASGNCNNIFLRCITSRMQIHMSTVYANCTVFTMLIFTIWYLNLVLHFHERFFYIRTKGTKRLSSNSVFVMSYLPPVFFLYKDQRNTTFVQQFCFCHELFAASFYVQISKALHWKSWEVALKKLY